MKANKLSIFSMLKIVPDRCALPIRVSQWIFGIVALGMLTVAAAPARAHLGYGIVAAEDGTVYFLDAVRSRVWRLSPSGELTVAASGYHANTLVAAPDGSLYFESFNQSLWRLSPRAASVA